MSEQIPIKVIPAEPKASKAIPKKVTIKPADDAGAGIYPARSQIYVRAVKGTMENKPASVFTSSGSIHGGNETTLLTMQLPLLHLGMLIMGVPYSTPSLIATKSGGTPYGASHIGGDNNQNDLTSDEKSICFAQGERIALLVKKING